MKALSAINLYELGTLSLGQLGNLPISFDFTAGVFRVSAYEFHQPRLLRRLRTLNAAANVHSPQIKHGVNGDANNV